MFIGSRGLAKQTVLTPANQADSMADHHGAPAPADETVFKSLVNLDMVVDNDKTWQGVLRQDPALDGIIRKIT